MLFRYHDKCCLGNRLVCVVSYTCVDYTVKCRELTVTEQSSHEAYNPYPDLI